MQRGPRNEIMISVSPEDKAAIERVSCCIDFTYASFARKLTNEVTAISLLHMCVQ